MANSLVGKWLEHIASIHRASERLWIVVTAMLHSYSHKSSTLLGSFAITWENQRQPLVLSSIYTPQFTGYANGMPTSMIYSFRRKSFLCPQGYLSPPQEHYQ